MSEENHTQSTPSVSKTVTQPAERPVWRDLLIPGSIVLAGIAIGAGLYFSNGEAPAGPTALVAENNPAPMSLLDLAVASGADKDDFASCFENGDTLNLVQEDIDNAVATGGRGTPWGILIGPNGNKYAVNGALPEASVEQLIAVARSEAEAGIVQAETAELQKLNLVTPVSDADHIRGNANGSVTIIEYSDFDCPFCTRFHATMNSVVQKDSDLRWIYRHFPLESLHPNAKAVAVASECVAVSGGDEAFWKFADSYLK